MRPKLEDERAKVPDPKSEEDVILFCWKVRENFPMPDDAFDEWVKKSLDEWRKEQRGRSSNCSTGG